MWKLLIWVSLPLVSSKCYWNNPNPYPYFGSKTPYDTVRGDFRDVPEIEAKFRQNRISADANDFSECEAVSIWFMIRHGTRRPNAPDTKIMKKASYLKDNIIHKRTQGKGEMCAQDVDDLRKWMWNPKLDYKRSYLTTHGFQELFEFGQRFSQKFANFLEEVNSSVLRPTSEQRTQQSIKAFVEGLRGINQSFPIEDYILNDPVARPYRYCAKRGSQIINGTRAISEIQRFQETEEFKKVQENVQRRTGLSLELKPNTIKGLYDLCRFYRSYTLLKRSPWCSLFSDDDLKILEYVEDVQHYFKNGFGDSLNSQTGAAGLKDLYEKFHHVTKTGHKSITAYFTHDTMMDMIYSAMGFYEDYPKLSGFERKKDRKWRTTFLTPFAANFVAVLYRCPKLPSTTYRVQFLKNEKEVHLCGARLCSWKQFWETFHRFTKANLDFCDDDTYVYSV
ncbi:multiple inositol polyphosphate phosphatase 1 [Bicyclus anynana]|uniref:Multiple inositol polyphosphate phosphatase 1 n=1 Tax=Bicyclus anynana TaxID=110368 RepID=A0ABM3LR35_BICAN|nr:multiple inositol polyphosphate phosphatase 1 [Bicyclus anynana]